VRAHGGCPTAAREAHPAASWEASPEARVRLVGTQGGLLAAAGEACLAGAGAAARSGGRPSYGGAVERPTMGVAIPTAGEDLCPGGCGIHGVVGKIG
jgi:hypothetical protein